MNRTHTGDVIFFGPLNKTMATVFSHYFTPHRDSPIV